MTPLLELVAVGRHHDGAPDAPAILEDVSLELVAGELVGVVAASPAAGTTLLRIAAGVEAPDRGTVRFGGQDIARMSWREREQLLRRRVGATFGPRPGAACTLSAIRQVALPLASRPLARGRALHAAHEMLERVGAGHLADTPVGELPAGAWLRVALAQALVRAPDVLLVDEPSAALDAGERAAILALLRELADAGVALLVSADDADAAAGATRIVHADGSRSASLSSSQR